MSNRKGLIGAAACAALALAGVVRAEDTSKPVYFDAAPARAPLMELLNKANLAKPLEDAGITIGGRVEGSWTYSASKPPANFISGRVFDFEHEDLTLNQVGLVVNRDVDGSKFDVGGRIEFIYGGDSRLIHSLGLFDYQGVGNGPGNQWDLNQAYVDVSLGNNIKVRAGKFVALAGYEVIDPTGNALYSHSFMFGYAIPFTHTGVLVSGKIGDSLTVAGGISRGWDTSTEDNNDTIDIIGQVAYALPDGKSNVIVNFTSGPDQAGDNGNWRTLVDLIVSTKMGDNLTLALNADYGYEANSTSTADRSDAQWYGVAVYATSVLSPMLSVTARAEYFNDQDGVRLTGGVGGTSLYEATLGFAVTPFPDNAIGKNLVIRPEVRFDYANKRFFDGGTDRYQVTAAVDAIFKF